MVRKLPITYIPAPNKPTFRIWNFLNKLCVNNPVKLIEQKKKPVIIATALVSCPKLKRKSLNNNPNEGMPPKAVA